MSVLALVFGWVVKEITLNRSQSFDRAGITANLPAKWQVNDGFSGDELIFTANAPLALNHRYLVHLLPAVPGGKVTDVVVTRNLSQGQNLAFYKVTSQEAIYFQGRNGYQVDYSYVKTGAAGEDPALIKGIDAYFEGSGKILVVSMEDEIDQFAAGLPGFFDFLGSIVYRPEVPK